MTHEEKPSLIIDDRSVRDIEVSESVDGDDGLVDDRPEVNPTMKEEPTKPPSLS